MGLADQYDKVGLNWFWIKGHAGHAENERCDQLVAAASGNLLSIDLEYEQTVKDA